MDCEFGRERRVQVARIKAILVVKQQKKDRKAMWVWLLDDATGRGGRNEIALR
jgi:hypothetical protein